MERLEHPAFPRGLVVENIHLDSVEYYHYNNNTLLPQLRHCSKVIIMRFLNTVEQERRGKLSVGTGNVLFRAYFIAQPFHGACTQLTNLTHKLHPVQIILIVR